MSERLSSLRGRLRKIEQQLAVIARLNVLAKCNCDETKFFVVFSDEERETVLNVRCPAHGRRRIAGIVNMVLRGPDGKRIGRGEFPVGAFSRRSRPTT